MKKCFLLKSIMVGCFVDLGRTRHILMERLSILMDVKLTQSPLWIKDFLEQLGYDIDKSNAY